MAGAAPPPGFHAMVFGNAYSASDLKDGSGKSVAPPGFRVDAVAVVPRLVWSTPQSLWGGNLVLHTLIPLVDLQVSAAGASQHKTGLGDITVGAGVAFHPSAQWHSVLGLDVLLPTGAYDKADLANIGRHTTSVQPLYAMSYLNATGFTADFKAALNFNQKNSATQYQSGTELFVDYAAGYGLGQGWTLGLGGYVRRQLSDDSQNGQTLSGRRAQALALGPSLKYDNGHGWFITAKLQHETAVKNSAQGNALWIKAIVPFSF